MSTISLNKEVILQNNMSVDEVLLMLTIINKVNLKEAEKSLISKGFITAERDSSFQQIGWRVTKSGHDILNFIIIDSDKHQNSQDSLTSLASKLKEIFPKGKKEGTNFYWAEGIALIIRRLKLFFKKYGNEFTDDQIISAAEKYVQGFNGDYRYMKLLKYFIFKEKLGVGGEVEGESELINYIENADQEDEINKDWDVTIR